MTASVTSTRPLAASERLEVWKRRTAPLVLVAALLPIVVGLAGRRSGPAIWVDLVSWMVFLVDLVVHIRLRPGHLRTKIGVFDLVIVVCTAPWYLLPGLDSARLLSLMRMARLGRVFLVSSHSRRLKNLGRRLGTAALSSLVLMLCCAAVVLAIEPASSGYDSFGDAMWWAMVTFTTVGYGDYFPVTSGGRAAAVLLMLGGISLIGSLAGTLGSFFGTSDDAEAEVGGSAEVAAPSSVESGLVQQQLLAEIRALRTEVAELRAKLD